MAGWMDTRWNWLLQTGREGQAHTYILTQQELGFNGTYIDGVLYFGQCIAEAHSKQATVKHSRIALHEG
jgi:hypothetical protein